MMKQNFTVVIEDGQILIHSGESSKTWIKFEDMDILKSELRYV